MTAKGIKRGYVKKNLRHEQYLRTIREKREKNDYAGEIFIYKFHKSCYKNCYK